MKTHTSQATRRASAAQSAKFRVMEIEGWSELDYATVQFETGILYLTLLLDDEHFERTLQRSRVFWSWWKNQWLLRDEQFLEAARYSDLNVNQAGRICTNLYYSGYSWQYFQYHLPQDLASDIHPNGVILRESYAAMVGRVIDESR